MTLDTPGSDMTPSPEKPGRHASLREQPTQTGDALLDARQVDDATYLAKLGYQQELNRALGLFSSFGVQFSLIAITSSLFTTAVVGLGFFGPASFWSYVVGGGCQVFLVGLAVAELVSAYPLSGGVYQITNRITRKAWLAWQSGWWMVVAHVVSVTAIAVSMVPFLAGWFGIAVDTPGETLPWVLGIIVLVTLVNLFSVKVAALVNNIGVIAELAASVLVIGALLLTKHDTQPISILANSGGTAKDGWLVPFLAAMLLPAYLISSFDATGNAAEETRNAARTAPLGTVLANTAAYFVGIAFFFLLLISIPDVSKIMASQTPIKDILESSIGSTVTNIFEAMAIVALFATMSMLQLTGVRVLWSQSRDGQMPAAKMMRKVNRAHIPVNATLVAGVISMLIALWSSLLTVLVAMTALAWAACYTVVVFAGLWAVARKTLPRRPWHYGRWSLPIFIGAGIWSVLLCIGLVVSDPLHVGLGMLGVIVAGFIFYFCIPSTRRGKVAGITSDLPVAE
jgi:amino acid transporter